jgi:type I restriction enzyme S subunit
MAFTLKVADLIATDTSGLLAKHSSWERVPLAEVAGILNGAPFDSALFSNTKGFPLVRIRDVIEGTTSTYYVGNCEQDYVVGAGDLLIGMDGDFHCAFWRSSQALLNQRVCKVTANEKFYLKKFLAHVLPGYLAAINANTPSTTVKHLSSKTVAEVDLPLPPAAEQTRIVDKLEELLSDLDTGVAELKAAQKKLAQYRQSLLKAAVEGRLTEAWRAQHGEPEESGAQLLARILRERRTRWKAKQLARFETQGKVPPQGWQDKYPEPVAPDTTGLQELPRSWVWASLDMLGEIASGVAKGTKRDERTAVREVPYLRVANVQRGYLDLTEVKTILATERDIEELTLQAGDVLFNEGGDRDKLGRGWVWRNEVETCIHQNHVFRMRPNLHELKPELISHHGNTFGKLWFQTAGKQTTNLASINMGMLREFPVPLAPVAEQAEILSQLELQLVAVVEQDGWTEHALRQATAQRKNILQAAFSGQLVPQDPNDEPASVLLARIRAEREGRPAKPRKSRAAKASA